MGCFGSPFFLLGLRIRLSCLPPLDSPMCGLIKLMVYRGGVTDVLHVTPNELKRTRERLAAEDWVIYHTENI